MQVKVETDLQFKMLANNAVNPSQVYVMYVNDGITDSICIGNGMDYTVIDYIPAEYAILCKHNTGHHSTACGTGNLPAQDALSGKLIFTGVSFNPLDGTAHNDQHHIRLTFTWSLTSYDVYALVGYC